MINISKNKCIGCGVCLSVCAEGIEMIDGIARVKNSNASCLKSAILACPQKAIKDIVQELIFAIGTDDGKTIKQDDHIGMARYYSIWKYSDGKMFFIERRENVKYEEDESRIHGDPKKAEKVSSVLTGVDAIVGRIIGPNIVRMKKKFVPIIIREPLIEKALEVIKKNINEIADEEEKEERVALVLN